MRCREPALACTTDIPAGLGSHVPTLKIASNSALAKAKPGWIDFDAGSELHRGKDLVAQELLDLMIATATAAQRRN